MNGFANIEQATLSDVGVRRSHNQDGYAVLLAADAQQWRKQGHLFLVADGMGAHAVGEKASELAAGVIPHTYSKYAGQGAALALQKAFLEANESIHSRGEQNQEFAGMGTTATALALRPDGAWVGHVGDSRVYRVRGGRIEQLSFDHSLLWELARRKNIDPDQLEGVPSNRIVRSLGPDPLVAVDLEGPHVIRTGDIFILCSDGLNGMLSDEEIGAVASLLPVEEACRLLVDLANLRGGRDNITVIVVRVKEVSTSSPAKAGGLKLHSYPWPLLALGSGIVLSVGTALLLAIGNTTFGLLILVLAVMVVMAGIAGLILQFLRDNRREEAEKEAPRSKPQIHRRASCKVNRPLLDKLMEAMSTLKQQARDQNWELDWTAYQHHDDRAVKHLAANDLPAAFHETCKELLILTEEWNNHRNKAEVFKPVWDKK